MQKMGRKERNKIMKQPLYLEISEYIKNKIIKGELKYGDKINSENELCEKFGTSRMTVRKGLAVLINENYIYPVPGKGNFVSDTNFNQYTLYYSELNSIKSSNEETKLLDVNIINPPIEIMLNLGIAQKKKIIVIKRCLIKYDIPIAYDIKYIPYYVGMPIVEKEIHYATFPEILAKEKSLFEIKKELKISGNNPLEEIQKILKITEDEPVLKIEQKILDNENKPIGFGITYFIAKYYKLKAISSKN